MQQGIPVRVRIPVVAGYTDTRENLSAVLDILAPYAGTVEQIDLLPYHRIGMHKYDKLGIVCGMPGEEGKMPESELFEWKMKFEETGIKVKTGG
jgi:pyruvate formate lyase activating enzyme